MKHLLKILTRIFPGGLMVKISLFSAGPIPGPGDKIPQASQSKIQNIKPKQYYNKSEKTVKMAHNRKIKKNFNRYPHLQHTELKAVSIFPSWPQNLM